MRIQVSDVNDISNVLEKEPRGRELVLRDRFISEQNRNNRTMILIFFRKEEHRSEPLL